MNLLNNILIIAIFLAMGITTNNSRKVTERNGNTQDYVVQINEEWINVVRLESQRFGVNYKGKLVSNVYLFQEDSTTYETEQSMHGISRNMKDFKEFFAEKIIQIERREYATVKYYPWRNETFLQPRMGFGRWILQNRTVAKREKCWPYYGMDVQEAWSLGYTGFNIRIAVVDTGIEIDHPDIQQNIDKDLSHSFVDRNHSNVKPLRFPSYWETEEITSHGTMVAGLIAGEFGNDVCSAGIAFDSKLIALKVFKLKEDPAGWIQDGFQFKVDYIPAALAYKGDEIDIYSCSFNLHNKFKAASLDMRTVLKEGAEKGRNGKGSIYVFSAGNNKGPVYDCNMEALASSIYTITISSVGTNGSKPSYAIPCASTLASTYGEFKTYAGSRKLETTTHGGKCDNFTGTSASAALASGIFALTLQANPELTWRDLQHIIILSSSFERLQHTGRLKRNSAGLQYDPFFGFGLVNATAMILLAKTWKTVPLQNQRTIYETDRKTRFISEETFAITLRFDSCEKEKNCVKFLEHVMINLQYKTAKESLLDIILCSPSQTCSYILNRRGSQGGVRKRAVRRDWNFTTVHFWGENPEGLWILLFKETPKHRSNLKTKHHLKFLSAELTLFGTEYMSFEKDNSVTVKQEQKHEKTNVTEWYDSILNNILKDFPDPDVDDVLDFVEETTKNPTNYWAGIMAFITFTAFLAAAIFRYVRCQTRKKKVIWFM